MNAWFEAAIQEQRNAIAAIKADKTLLPEYQRKLLAGARAHLETLRKATEPSERDALTALVLNSLSLSLRDQVSPATLARAAARVVEVVTTAQQGGAISARHDQVGGSRYKKAQLIEAWKSGRFSTKEQCIEWARGAPLHMADSTARRNLRNQ